MKSFGYAINPPRVNDSSRETVVRDMGKFMRVDDMVDAQVISAIAGDDLHVIVDLMGYTHGAKERVLSAQPAPLIIAWKGFMGSSGSKHVSRHNRSNHLHTGTCAIFLGEISLCAPRILRQRSCDNTLQRPI